MPVNLPVLSLIRIGIIVLLFILASIWDIRKRIVPNLLPVLLALTTLIPKPEIHPTGIVVAVLLLIIGIYIGGIGGGDIKMIAAYGIVRGAFEVTIAVTLAMLFLLIYHGATYKFRKEKRKAYPLMPFFMLGCIAAGFLCI